MSRFVNFKVVRHNFQNFTQEILIMILLFRVCEFVDDEAINARFTEHKRVPLLENLFCLDVVYSKCSAAVVDVQSTVLHVHDFSILVKPGVRAIRHLAFSAYRHKLFDRGMPLNVRC